MAKPTILDAGDATYFAHSSRERAALAWYEEKMASEPGETKWLIAYLRSLSMVPKQRSPVLVELVEQWRDEHPEAGDVGVALALAHGLSAMDPRMMSSIAYSSENQSYCEDAVAALAALPEDPNQRYRVLSERSSLPAVCGVDADAAKEQMQALARTGAAGAYPRAWFAAKESLPPKEESEPEEAESEVAESVEAESEVAESEEKPDAVETEPEVVEYAIGAEAVAALREAVAEHPWKAARLGLYFGEGLRGDAETARQILLDTAAQLVESEQPSRVAAAASVYSSAKLHTEAVAAYRRLQELDPENSMVRYRIEWLEKEIDKENDEEEGTAEPSEEEPEATTVLDPVKRMAALEAERPGKGSWAHEKYWAARADAAQALGDEVYLDNLDKYWRRSTRYEPNLLFAVEAVEQGKRLRAAKSALKVYMSYAEDAPRHIVGGGEDWREAYAKALELEAKLLAIGGKDRRAIDNLEKALALSPPTPSRLVELGRLYAKKGDYSGAHPLLAAGLASGGRLDEELRDEGMAALTNALDRAGVWNPGDTESWVAATAIQRERSRGEQDVVALDKSRFEDFEVEIDGQQQRLLDIEGPLVVDLWATWCGPCMESLPHLDSLNRKHGDEVTFVAVSVDKVAGKAKKYIERRGGASFVAAYAPTGMEDLGVSGIPAMFVFDAEHNLVARLTGWGPGSTALDDAVQEMLSTVR